MARIATLTDEEAADDELLGILFEGCERLIGRVPNSMRIYGRVPITAAWLLPFLVSLQREGAGGRLDGRTKELIVMKTSLANGCDYCVTHNTMLAQATGLEERQIELLDGDYLTSDLLSGRDKAVLRWSEAVTRNDAPRDNAGFEALREYFDDDEIVEITWLSAMFNMLNRVHDSLHIDIEWPDEVARIQRSVQIPHESVVAWAKEMIDVMCRRNDFGVSPES